MPASPVVSALAPPYPLPSCGAGTFQSNSSGAAADTPSSKADPPQQVVGPSPGAWALEGLTTAKAGLGSSLPACSRMPHARGDSRCSQEGLRNPRSRCTFSRAAEHVFRHVLSPPGPRFPLLKWRISVFPTCGYREAVVSLVRLTNGHWDAPLRAPSLVHGQHGSQALCSCLHQGLIQKRCPSLSRASSAAGSS